jgi:hypothetical protein
MINFSGKPDPALSISLEFTDETRAATSRLQLNREHYAHDGYDNLVITSLDPNPAHIYTLVCSGTDREGKHLNLLHALQCGLIELLDPDTGEALKVPPGEAHAPGCVEIAYRRPAHRLPLNQAPPPPQARITLVADWTSPLWKTLLQPGKTYAVCLSPSKGEAWAYHGIIRSESIDDVPSSLKLSVSRDITPIHLAVFDDPPPPRLFVTLSMPEKCHISGTPPFTVVLEFSTDSETPITLDKSHTPLSSFWLDFHTVEDLFQCRNRNTGELIEFPARFGCFDSDPHDEFPSEDDFVQIRAGEPWHFEYVLKEDEAPGGPGGLEDLEAGETYDERRAAGREFGGED